MQEFRSPEADRLTARAEALAPWTALLGWTSVAVWTVLGVALTISDESAPIAFDGIRGVLIVASLALAMAGPVLGLYESTLRSRASAAWEADFAAWLDSTKQAAADASERRAALHLLGTESAP